MQHEINQVQTWQYFQEIWSIKYSVRDMNDNERVLSEMINITLAIENSINGFICRLDTSE